MFQLKIRHKDPELWSFYSSFFQKKKSLPLFRFGFFLAKPKYNLKHCKYCCTVLLFRDIKRPLKGFLCVSTLVSIVISCHLPNLNIINNKINTYNAYKATRTRKEITPIA